MTTRTEPSTFTRQQQSDCKKYERDQMQEGYYNESWSASEIQELAIKPPVTNKKPATV